MVTEFDAVPELVPDWNRHPLLASEMHDTKAHRLTSHTQPSLSPAKPAHRGFPQLPPSFVASRASVGEVDRGRCHFSVAKLLLAVLYQPLKPPPPSAGTPQRALVPERVGRVPQSPGLLAFSIHQPDPWAGAGPVRTAPLAHPQLSDQTRQRRKTQKAPRTQGPILYPAYPPCTPDNPLNSQEPVRPKPQS